MYIKLRFDLHIVQETLICIVDSAENLVRIKLQTNYLGNDRALNL